MSGEYERVRQEAHAHASAHAFGRSVGCAIEEVFAQAITWAISIAITWAIGRAIGRAIGHAIGAFDLGRRSSRARTESATTAEGSHASPRDRDTLLSLALTLTRARAARRDGRERRSSSGALTGDEWLPTLRAEAGERLQPPWAHVKTQLSVVAHRVVAARTFPDMADGGHWPSVVSWAWGGVEIECDSAQVCDAVVARAWACSCGWRGEVRSVDDRFHRPPGDAGGRLRATRVRRADRMARPEWDDHARQLGGDVDDDDDNVVGRAERLPSTLAASTPDHEYPANLSSLPLPHSVRAERARRRQQAEQLEVSGPGRTAPGLASAPEAGPPPKRGEDIGADGGIAPAASRVQRARVELAAAEADLQEVVRRGRAEGLSWRAIAAETGVDHRTARRTWFFDAAGDAAF